MHNLSSFIKLSAILEAFGNSNTKVPTLRSKTPVIGVMKPRKPKVAPIDPLVKGQSNANFLRSKYRKGQILAAQGRASVKQYFGGVKRPIGAPPQYGKMPI